MAYHTQVIDQYFQKIGVENGIDPLFLKAISIQESGENPNVKPNKNNNGTYDYGLMQINSGDAKEFGYNVFELQSSPTYNIQAAVDTIKRKQAMLSGMGKDPTNLFNIAHAYNGWTDQGAAYASKVMGIYQQLGGKQNAAVPYSAGSVTSLVSSTTAPSVVSPDSLLARITFVAGGVLLVLLGIFVATNPEANLAVQITKGMKAHA
jgi:hypothetical protein